MCSTFKKRISRSLLLGKLLECVLHPNERINQERGPESHTGFVAQGKGGGHSREDGKQGLDPAWSKTALEWLGLLGGGAGGGVELDPRCVEQCRRHLQRLGEETRIHRQLLNKQGSYAYQSVLRTKHKKCALGTSAS